jgi:hypothetical protein
MSTAIVKTSPLPMAQMSATPLVNVQALIDKAIDAKSAVEIIKELRAMALDEQARNAKRAFDEAMTAFQSECPTITKDKAVPDRNGKTAYKYAPIEVIETLIRPLLQRHGFSHTFDVDTASKDGWVIVKCIVHHAAGHERDSTGKFPLGTKTGIMSDTQQYAAALTFANRRALQNAYGLVLAGEDLDGAGPKPKPPGPSSLGGSKPLSRNDAENKRKLVDLLRPYHGAAGQNLTDSDKQNIEQYLIDEAIISDTEKLADLCGQRLADVVAKVEARNV